MMSHERIGQSPSAIINVKRRLLRAVGLLALFSALVMEFHRGTPIANEGVGGGGKGGGS